MTRTYESNGPDVKIRGTAHHVAEKYLQLARDAQSSGDPVMAESYLQHAEHYFRLIAAAQLAQQQAQQGFMRQPGDPEPAEEVEDDDDGGIPDRFASPLERQQPQPQQQPFYPPQAGQPQPQQGYAERPFNNDQPRQDRPYQDRNNQQRQDRPYQDRNQFRNNNQNRNQRDQRPPRDFRNNDQPRYDQRPERPPYQPQPQPQPVADEAPDTGLPSFITAPVRAAMPESVVSEQPVAGAADAAPQDAGAGEAGRFHLRNRRRRRPAAADEGAGESAQDTAPAGE